MTARRRAIRTVAALLAILLLALLLTGRPSVEADATCNVPPTNLTSALGADGASVVLNWEASGECVPDVYAVHRRDMDVAGSRMTKIDSVDGDVLTYTDTTVTAGETYRYKIRSNDLGSRSSRTEITIPEATASEPEGQGTESSSTEPPRSVPPNEITLVSNFGRTLGASSNTIMGQPFTTGSNTAGYGLNSVELLLTETSGSTTLSVKIFSTTTNGEPTTELHALSNPDTITDGTLVFTAPENTTLAASTTFAVVISNATGGTLNGQIDRVNTTGEDTGGADGWSIGNRRFHKSSATADWDDDTSTFVRMRIKGTIVVANSAPEFNAGLPSSVNVEENEMSSVDIGSPFTATDADTGDTLTYWPTGDDASSFAIVSTSGQLQTSAALDFETKSSYSVTINVRDSKDADGNADTDSDDSLTWSLAGPDADDFTIGSGNGELRFSNVPDFEEPADNDGDGVYRVTVQVRDGKNAAGQSDSAIDASTSVTVTVRNVNEAPEITTTGTAFTSISKPEGTVTTEVLVLYDADDQEQIDVPGLTWTLSGDDAGRFSIYSRAAGRASSRFRPSPTSRTPWTSAPTTSTT